MERGSRLVLVGVNIFTLFILVYNLFEWATGGIWTWKNWIVFINILLWDGLILLIFFRYDEVPEEEI